MLFVYGLLAGFVSGGFLAYMFADSIVTKTVAEFKRIEGAAAEEFLRLKSKVTTGTSNVYADVKKDL